MAVKSRFTPTKLLILRRFDSAWGLLLCLKSYIGLVRRGIQSG
jgi:hypothetical protein